MVSRLQTSFVSISPNQVALVALAGLGPSRSRLYLWPETRDQIGKNKETNPDKPTRKSNLLKFSSLHCSRV